MASLTILVGIPGCGKSTFAKVLKGYVVSSDSIRARLGDINDQSRNDDVFKLFHDHIRADLHHGEDVIADSTALDARARESLRNIARDERVKVHLIYFSNVVQAVRRNRLRERVVPEHVMDKMLHKYEIFKRDLPQESVEYETITEIRSYA